MDMNTDGRLELAALPRQRRQGRDRFNIDASASTYRSARSIPQFSAENRQIVEIDEGARSEAVLFTGRHAARACGA